MYMDTLLKIMPVDDEQLLIQREIDAFCEFFEWRYSIRLEDSTTRRIRESYVKSRSLGQLNEKFPVELTTPIKLAFDLAMSDFWDAHPSQQLNYSAIAMMNTGVLIRSRNSNGNSVRDIAVGTISGLIVKLKEARWKVSVRMRGPDRVIFAGNIALLPSDIKDVLLNGNQLEDSNEVYPMELELGY